MLIAGNPDHPEWDIAIDLLDDLALSSGYRTDDLAERLRDKAKAEARDIWARDPAPVSSGREVAEEVKTVIRWKAEDDHPSQQVIEDYRSVPRNVRVPSHMRIPGRG